MKRRSPLPSSLVSPFTRQQGLNAGVTESRLRGGDLQRPFRGVCTTKPGLLTVIDLCRALQSKLPDYAYFCGPTAAVVMGVPLPARLEDSRVLHVAVPEPRRAPVGRGVAGHQLATTPGEVRHWHGIRLGSPERVWCQLGAVLAVDDLVAAGDYLIHWRHPLTNEDRLRLVASERGGSRGIRRVREAVPLLDNRSESPQESRLRVILVRAGVPGLAVNLPITTSGGFRYRADLAVPAHSVIIEYQSEFHRDSRAFRADMTRISRLEADGWHVIQVNADDLRNPVELVARIRHVLARHPLTDR